eukprot:41859-Ditylum_brightwellii.AAC.1
MKTTSSFCTTIGFKEADMLKVSSLQPIDVICGDGALIIAGLAGRVGKGAETIREGMTFLRLGLEIESISKASGARQDNTPA